MFNHRLIPKPKFVLNSAQQHRLVLLLSVVIGIVSGLAAVLLKNIVHYTNDHITHGFDFAEGNYLYLAFPLIGIGLTVLFAKFINIFLKIKINPLLGAAGVSAVPDSARVVQHVGHEADPTNFLLMHAMAPNVSGVIGSAVGAGILWSFLIK
jgi:hypothetical protein